MRVPDKAWASKPEYQSLLYFCQLLDDMVWYWTRDSHRAPAMNTYHLCEEILRSWDEVRTSSLREGIMSVMFDELRATAAVDPTVVAHFAVPFERLDFALTTDETAAGRVGAVDRFFHQIRQSYLKRCRDEIERIVGSAKAVEKERLATLARAFCSYIQNVGHTPRHISRRLNGHFFNRELDAKPVRELQGFFADFSCRESSFDVLLVVSDQLATAGNGRDFDLFKGKLPRAARFSTAFGEIDQTGDKIVRARNVVAYDEFGAVARVEASLALLRAVAYTARADAICEWRSEAVVTSDTDRHGLLVGDRVEPLRQRYRDRSAYQFRAVGESKRAVFETELPITDANRLKNALIGYSNAFHSESPATQLVALWSSLEGLLPPAQEGEGRIDAVVRYALACQRSTYLHKLFEWSFVDHLALGGSEFLALIDEVPGYSARLSKFAVLLCFPPDASLSKKLGTLAAQSPLTTQRGFRLHSAAAEVTSLRRLIDAHERRVDWQLRRIYRERNRIVHQASPSANVNTLILNLNEYLAVVFDVLFTTSPTWSYAMGLDGVFNAIVMDERYRQKQIAKLGKVPLSVDNAEIVLGFPLN